jgi:hypothetical protein
MLEDRSDFFGKLPESPGGGWVHGRYATAREKGLPSRESTGKRLQRLRTGRWRSRSAVRWEDGHGKRGLAGHWHVDGVSPSAAGQLVIPYGTERSSSGDLAGLKDVDGFGELPGAPWVAAQLAQDVSGS